MRVSSYAEAAGRRSPGFLPWHAIARSCDIWGLDPMGLNDRFNEKVTRRFRRSPKNPWIRSGSGLARRPRQRGMTDTKVRPLNPLFYGRTRCLRPWRTGVWVPCPVRRPSPGQKLVAALGAPMMLPGITCSPPNFLSRGRRPPALAALRGRTACFFMCHGSVFLAFDLLPWPVRSSLHASSGP